MPPTASVELSLINDAPPPSAREPLLAVAAPEQQPAVSAAIPEDSYADSFEGLDSDLPFGPDAGQSTAVAPHHELASEAEDDYGALYDQPVRKERHVTLMMAAVVLVACLTAGAAVAAFVFTAG